MLFFAASEAPPRPESMKFPVNSLLAGNLAFSETSSQLTPRSSGESPANRRARGETLRHKVNDDGPTLSRAPSDSPPPPPSRRTAAEGFLKFRARLLTPG